MVSAVVTLYDWLLFLHISGAFFLIGGIVVAGILNLSAIGKDRLPARSRPSTA